MDSVVDKLSWRCLPDKLREVRAEHGTGLWMRISEEASELMI